MRLLFLLLFIPISFFSQENIPICGSDIINKKMMEKDSKFAKKMQDFEGLWQKVQQQPELYDRIITEGGNKEYVLPVVVHIINTGSGTSPDMTDQDVIDWIDYTNQVFAGTYTGIVGENDGGTSFPIRLALAQVDEDCQSTSGIVRVDGSAVSGYATYGLNAAESNGAAEASIRALSRWDSSKYYNIYIVNMIDGDATPYGIGGYAYYPFSSSQDGAYMKAAVAEVDNTVLPHEMGHAFNLKHPFDGASSSGGVCPTNDDCTTDNDAVCDTESIQSQLSVSPCKGNTDTNPCTGTDFQGTQYNIMNYGYCPDRFTPGQRDRAVLAISTLRTSQINSYTEVASSTTSVTSACSPTSISNASNAANIGVANINLGELEYASGGYTNDGNEYYIDHTSSCSENYTTNLVVGNTYDLTVSVALNSTYVEAWIDYNNDGTFDESSEEVFSATIAAYGETTQSVSIPTTGVVYDTPLRMRFFGDFSSYSSSVSPCANPVYGQVEDFTVTILSAAPTETFGVGNVESANAAFQIDSDSSGVLFPRMSTSQMYAISSPAQAMLVYNTTEKCLAINYGTEGEHNWKCFEMSSTSNLRNGTSSVNPKKEALPEYRTTGENYTFTGQNYNGHLRLMARDKKNNEIVWTRDLENYTAQNQTTKETYPKMIFVEGMVYALGNNQEDDLNLLRINPENGKVIGANLISTNKQPLGLFSNPNGACTLLAYDTQKPNKIQSINFDQEGKVQSKSIQKIKIK